MVHAHEPPKAFYAILGPSAASWNRQKKDAGYLDYTGLSLD